MFLFLKNLKYRFTALLLFFNEYPSLITCFTIIVTVCLSTKFLEIDLFEKNTIDFPTFNILPWGLAILIVIFTVSYVVLKGVLNIYTFAKYSSIGLLLAFGSMYVFIHQVAKESEKVLSFIGKEVSFQGNILSKESPYQFLFRASEGDIGEILLRTTGYSVIHTGQRCTVTGKVVEPKSFDDFDYKRFLFRKRIYLILELKEYNCYETGSFLLLSRHKVERIIERSMPEPESSLLIGIMFGSKRVFLKEFNDQLRESGVSHIIAASGYNVALLTVGIESLTRFLKGKESLLVKISSIWIFASFSGLSASLIRASTMSTVYFVSLLFGRYTSKSVVVVICATILLMLNPFLMYDIGFLLSLFSTVGLIFFPKCFQDYKLGLLKSSVLPTFTCVLFTLPILILFFGRVSIISILTNVLVLPIIQTTIFWGLGITFLNIFSDIFGILYIIPYLQLLIFKYIVIVVSSFPMLELEISPVVLCSGLYTLIFIFCLYKYPISIENYYLKEAKKICSTSF